MAKIRHDVGGLSMNEIDNIARMITEDPDVQAGYAAPNKFDNAHKLEGLMYGPITLIHSGNDYTGAITICADGTKVYWEEGAGVAVIVHPNGEKERVDAQSNHPVLLRPELTDGTENQRPMTAQEESDYDMVME
jgi:hypothetical protein